MLIGDAAAGAKNDNTMTVSNLEQEIRSLKFELSQQAEILTLRTETLNNVQD